MDRIKKVDEIRKWMDECKEFSAEAVVLHPTNGIGITLNNSMGYKSFEKIIYEAEDIKLKVAIENTRMLNSSGACRHLSYFLGEVIAESGDGNFTNDR